MRQTVHLVLIPLAFLGFIVLYVWALVDVVRREFGTLNTKLGWLVVIFAAQWPGAIVYLLVGRRWGSLPQRDTEKCETDSDGQ